MDVSQIIQMSATVGAVAIASMFLTYLAKKDKADREENRERRDSVSRMAQESNTAILKCCEAISENTAVIRRIDERCRYCSTFERSGNGQ